MSKTIEMTGQRFGRLTVLEQHPVRSHDGRVQWVCRCDCGNTTIVAGRELRTGNTRSCGCLVREHAARMARGHTDARHVTHGLSNTPEYSIWCDMKRRCYDPNNKAYAHYGGRGITMCDRWRESFEAFYRDMGPRPGPQYSIEREDHSGQYSPDNCQWIQTRLQQSNTTRNNYITFDGQERTLFEWAREYGISPVTLCSRLGRGWPLDEALRIPVKKRTPKQST